MLVFIEGEVAEIGVLHVVIQIGGFGYRVNAPLTTIEKLPKIGNSTKLYLSEIIRENQHELYGFSSKSERDFFEELIGKVSGVGPKNALNIMSSLSINMLKSAIMARDVGLLSKCHGVGKKTAERIVTELSGKIDLTITSRDSYVVTGTEPNIMQDAVCALISLGYRPAEADKCIRHSLASLGENASTEELIKYTLQS